MSEPGNVQGRQSVAGCEKPSAFRPAQMTYPTRIANSLARVSGFFGFKPWVCSADSLAVAAMKRTGLSTWDEMDIQEPLRILLGCYRNNDLLHFAGWRMIRETLTKYLCNRLMIRRDLEEHPEILNTRINRPLIITGLPRSGTTLLHNLLALDPANRAPLCWEVVSPSPPPDPATHDSDPRIATTERGLSGFYRQLPSFASIHMTHARGPDECVHLLANSLRFPSFHSCSDTPEYDEWLDGQDMIPVYEHYKRQLQMLTWRFPERRLVLKAPWHMCATDSLLAVFPDATIIQSHRSVLKVIPSICSLTASVRALYCREVDLSAAGRHCLEEWKDLIDKNIRLRNSSLNRKFRDVFYGELVADPVGAVERIYAGQGWNCEDDFKQSMRRWLGENRGRKHGRHEYSLEQFGLSSGEVRESFSEYSARYDIGDS